MLKTSYQLIHKDSAPGSISYMWDHFTYPEMTLSTQKLPLLSLLIIYDFTVPDGNLLQSKITRETVICYFPNQPTNQPVVV